MNQMEIHIANEKKPLHLVRGKKKYRERILQDADEMKRENTIYAWSSSSITLFVRKISRMQIHPHSRRITRCHEMSHWAFHSYACETDSLSDQSPNEIVSYHVRFLIDRISLLSLLTPFFLRQYWSVASLCDVRRLIGTDSALSFAQRTHRT